MRTLIYSDVHGNLPAFEKMIKEAGMCDQYICLGDLVNYGPWSNECVDLALSLPEPVVITGNHEEAFINGNYPGKNELVQQFFQQTINDFKRFDEIRNFMPSYILNEFICTHTIRGTYIYPDTNVVLDNNYIIGHSHHQFRYVDNGYVLYNAGSVGQNRKVINIANYLICDDHSIEMKSLQFDIEIVIDKMKVLNYPQECINYYKSKPIS